MTFFIWRDAAQSANSSVWLLQAVQAPDCGLLRSPKRTLRDPVSRVSLKLWLGTSADSNTNSLWIGWGHTVMLLIRSSEYTVKILCQLQKVRHLSWRKPEKHPSMLLNKYKLAEWVSTGSALTVWHMEHQSRGLALETNYSASRLAPGRFLLSRKVLSTGISLR